MNYFAHGIRFLDSPWFLAGTAAPDWLSVADRKVRLRERNLQPFLESDDEKLREFAAGVLQHLHDDHWFHDTVAFYEVTSAVADQFRTIPDQNDGFLPGFLGHISTELLLDRFLAEECKHGFDEYYRAIDLISPDVVQSYVNLIAVRNTDRLSRFVTLFGEIQFLYDYHDSTRLLHRLNQVLSRVKLQPLPEHAVQVLESSWEIVARRGWELLPEDKFDRNNLNLSTTHRRTPT